MVSSAEQLSLVTGESLLVVSMTDSTLYLRWMVTAGHCYLDFLKKQSIGQVTTLIILSSCELYFRSPPTNSGARLRARRWWR